MKWTKITLTTTTQAVDLVSAMLDELGIEGIEIEDNQQLSEEDRKKMFIDILPELGPDDGKAYVSFYVEDPTKIEETMEAVRNGLIELDDFVNTGSKEMTISETEDKDWIDNWKQFFKPFRVDESIVIKPTWETLENQKESDMVIEIDPGTAFGTGAHETTKLCMLSLKKQLKTGMRVIDVGCGSGILSIAARMFGASYVVGTDIDSNAVIVSKENAEQNHMPSEISLAEPGEDITVDETVKKAAREGCGFYFSNVLTEERARKELGTEFDLVVANILADVIIPLSEVAGEFLKPGGLFISSGIIYRKADAVEEALVKNKFEIVEKNVMGDWVSFTARKPE